jgi:hypothetical protein
VGKFVFIIGMVLGIIILSSALFVLYNYKLSQTNFDYDVEYDDLVTRKVWAFSIPASEIIPQRNCHKFTTNELSSLPKDLKYVMEESTASLFPEDIKSGFYSGFSNPIKFDDAKKLLEKYDFTVTQKAVYDILNKINDTTYHFECIFEDDKYQYKLGFDFDSHYAKDKRLVFVNVTKNDQGTSIIENQHVNIFFGGFNGTIIFNNKLEKAITIQITNPPADGDWTEHFVDDEMTIPTGKVWDVSPRNWHTPDDLVYQYIITQENLQGTFTLKNYPHCMTESEVKSLYSQVEVYPKFPLYIPEGYSFECGVHNTNVSVYLVYFTDEQRLQYSDRVNSAFNRNFFANGGLVIDYYDEVSNVWIADPNYDKFEKAQENAQYPQSTRLYILDEPAVMAKEYFWDDGKQQSFNRLEIFLDEERIQIKSSLPEEKLIKIAESMVKQNKN